MKTRNQILNYFVSSPQDSKSEARVFLAPITMNASVGKILIDKELEKSKNKLPKTNLLHVCFDMNSKIIYVPNANDFLPNQIKPLLSAAKKKIEDDFGIIPSDSPVEGSPFSLIRIRKVSNFGYTKDSIKAHFGEDKFNDIPVIEANLARMPETTKQLPCIYQKNKNFVGGYVGSSVAKSIKFYDEIDIKGKTRKKESLILEQETPFILIDISPAVNPGATEKEWAVLSGYRDYMYDRETSINGNCNLQDINSFADLYAAKRHLYLGWPFEEVCKIFLERVKNFGELINGVQLLMTSVHSLIKEGYTNPAKSSYYITFKADLKTFPLNLESIMTSNTQFDSNKQIDSFRIIEYDKSSGFIIIETPAYIETDICIKILKAKSRPFISRYNPTMNSIDVKSQAGLLRELQVSTNQIEKIKSLISYEVNQKFPDRKDKADPEFRTDNRARAVSLANPNICHVRKISEYFYACDFIKKMCKERNLPFIDIDVVIGPLERIFGPGVKGGFMGEKQFVDSKMKIPHQLVKGLWVSPPLMAVDSASMPSYAKQTETLIHEYSHNLFNLVNPKHKHLYHGNPKLRKKDELQYWYLYLTDPDERLSHKEEIKYSLLSGASVDEIIRDKVGGEINVSNHAKSYPIAMKFKELVEEALEELQKEEK